MFTYLLLLVNDVMISWSFLLLCCWILTNFPETTTSMLWSTSCIPLMYTSGNQCQLSSHELNMFLHCERNWWASKPPKLPLPHGWSEPHLTHRSSTQPHSPPQTAARSLNAFSHSSTINFPLVTMGHPISTPKIAPSCGVIRTPSTCWWQTVW